MISKIQCMCSWCKKKFMKPLSEFNRTVKRGRKHCCSLGCAGLYRNSLWSHKRVFTLEEGTKGVEAARLSKVDEHTPFRYFMRKNSSHHYTKHELTLDIVKEVWEAQNGICDHTGIPLTLPTSVAGFCDNIPPHKRASIDRIDNTKGYIKDNIHFVSYMSNLAKNRFGELNIQEFIQDIRKYTREI